MRRKHKHTSSPSEAKAEEGLSYDEYSSIGGRPPGVGARRNVAPTAFEREPEDYNEQNRRNVGGRGGRGIQTGNYEEDYGPGAKGLRNPEFQTEPSSKESRKVLRRETRTGETSEDNPSGVWADQRTKARLRAVKSRKARARPSTGRGVGLPAPRRGGMRPTRGGAQVRGSRGGTVDPTSRKAGAKKGTPGACTARKGRGVKG